MNSIQTVQLAIQLQKGEEGAFEALYTKLWEPVFRYALERLQNEEDAKDAAQDVFTDVYTEIGRPYNPFDFQNRLLTMTQNACRKYSRRPLRDSGGHPFGDEPGSLEIQAAA